ncbi:MAG: PQQ-binding-like beta-propeller repeat protein [Haloarculaceae archaeon]
MGPRPRTAVAFLAVVVAVGGVGAFALLSGGPGLTERWVSDTESTIEGNHHAVAAARIDGRGLVFAPVGGRGGGSGCALVGIDANGTTLWRDPVPAANCTIHAVADPTVADWTDDSGPEVLAATTERRVTAHDPLTGEETFSYPLSDYGYTRPVVADATGDGDRTLVVLDVRGTVFVLDGEGAVWNRSFGSYTWAQPAVLDADADGDPEVLAGFDDGHLRTFEGATGDVEWNRSVGGPVTWLTAGQGDDDPAVEAVAATSDGRVVAVDGDTGRIEWKRYLGRLAAVRAFADADDDGVVEVYATARDGDLRSLDARTGRTEWTTTLTGADVQMTPPPSLGDLDGDGRPELVAVTNDGIVRVLDPGTGEILATYERDASLYTHATLADLDADRKAELYVPYGDGRVVALEFG